MFEDRRWPLWNPQRGIFKLAGEEGLDYAFMGDDPSAADNVWLREAAERVA